MWSTSHRRVSVCAEGRFWGVRRAFWRFLIWSPLNAQMPREESPRANGHPRARNRGLSLPCCLHAPEQRKPSENLCRARPDARVVNAHRALPTTRASCRDTCPVPSGTGS